MSGFGTTHWSLILAAKARGEPQADESFAALCRLYWFPLYAFVRARSRDGEEAADLTQEFFLRLIEKDFLRSVDPSRGRFRSFLLAACKHFLANQIDRSTALKRGGGARVLSVDWDDAESRYLMLPSTHGSLERRFERQWGLELLDRTLARLALEFHVEGKGALFDRLKPILAGDSAGTYSDIGDALGMSEPAVKKAAERLRRRYRSILREQIAATVEGPDEVDDEIRDLFRAFSP